MERGISLDFLLIGSGLEVTKTVPIECHCAVFDFWWKQNGNFFSQQQVTTAGVVYWPRGLRQGIGAAGAVPCFFFRAMSRSLGA
mmetsp:Transcript_31635/g.75892  ORF Transcript_31635/g.75892 Transcript_31635/m.75892 type:complete len:84 (+) Transcript_31635:1458-1709(+)